MQNNYVQDENLPASTLLSIDMIKSFIAKVNTEPKMNLAYNLRVVRKYSPQQFIDEYWLTKGRTDGQSNIKRLTSA